MCDVQKVMDAIFASKNLAETYPEGPLREQFRDRFVATFPDLLADLLDEKADRVTFLKARLRIWQRMAEGDLWCDFIRAQYDAGRIGSASPEPLLAAARTGIADEIENIRRDLLMLEFAAHSPDARQTASQLFYNHAVRNGLDPADYTLREVLEKIPVAVIF